MPFKSKSRKRARSDRHAEITPEENHCNPTPPKSLRTQRAASHLQSKEKISEENSELLTRRRAHALGKELASPEDDPERYLRRKRRQQAQNTPVEDKKNHMDRSGTQRGNAAEDDDQARHGLQGLLRRLGAGFEDVFPMAGLGGGSGRIKSILATIRDEDEASQLSGLTELCEYISISTEESMISFPMEQAVPLLIDLLGHEHNPDIMLLAARALTFLADVFPPSAISIIRHNAVPAFCARLLTIEYIDLAEQSLQALEKLSHDHPASLLRAGALVAVLSYIDFFQTGVQRVAAATAANICRGLTTEHIDAVSVAAPILIGLLKYSDAKIVDSACLALTRIAQTFARDTARMEMLCGFGLISSIVEMVSISDTGSITSQLSSSTFYGLIKLLAACASGSHVVAENLLEAGISGTLHKLLSTSPLLSAVGASPANVLRSSDQLEDLVALVGQLLPPVPDATVIFMKEPLPVPPPNVSTAMLVDDEDGGAPSMTALAAYLRDNPATADRVTRDLLATMVHVYTSGSTSHVKRQSLDALIKIIYYAPAETLASVLTDISISSLIARLLSSTDSPVAAKGLHVAEILMEKLPEVFGKYFLKEGVVHAMEDLCAGDEYAVTTPSAALPITTTTTTTTTITNNNNNNNNNVSGAGKSNTSPPSGSGMTTRRRAHIEQSKAIDTPPTSGAKKTPANDNTNSLPGGAGIGSDSSSSSLHLRSSLKRHARRFLTRYFTDDQGNMLGGLQTEGVQRLSSICARLPDRGAVEDLLAAMSGSGDASISTFELLSSGAVHALRTYLQGDDIDGCNANDDDTKRQWRVLERLGQFTDAALPAGSGGHPPMLALVEKLQSVLSACEKFPVRINSVSTNASNFSVFYGGIGGTQGRAMHSRSGGGASGNTSLSAGLAALGNPFKIKLSRHPEEKKLDDYSSNVVLIEPLAAMSQIEDFLWARVQRREGRHTAGTHHRHTHTSTLPAPLTTATTATTTTATTTATTKTTTAAPATTTTRDPRGASRGQSSQRPSREPSQSRPIPPSQQQHRHTSSRDGKERSTGARLTRAQARAAAEAEVAAQGKGAETSDGGDDGSDEFPDAMLLDEPTPSPAGGTAAATMPPPGVAAAGGADAATGATGHTVDDTLVVEHAFVRDGTPSDGDDDDMMDDEDDEYTDDYVEGNSDVYDDEDDEEDVMMHTAMHVHDMHLNEESTRRDRGRTTTTATTTTTADATNRSYAAATTQGIAPASGTAAGSAAPPKLVFYVDNRRLDPSTTIFQAVQQAATSGGARASGSAVSQASNSNIGFRLWNDVHTLKYRLYSSLEEEEREKERKEKEERKNDEQHSMEIDDELHRHAAEAGIHLPMKKFSLADSPLSALTTPPLIQKLYAAAAAAANNNNNNNNNNAATTNTCSDIPLSKDVEDVLAVLAITEGINRLAPRLLAALEYCRLDRKQNQNQGSTAGGLSLLPPGHVPRDSFVNSRLSPKLSQQLKDVISICANTLPLWCHELACNARFLFSFEIRRRYFYCTSFGLSRALLYLQQSHAAEQGGGSSAPGSERDTSSSSSSLRIGRVQRQKVRIARGRILESSHRIFETYTDAKSQLEVEFFDEAGSGLGPTLEFYTLLSHEFQRKDLRMWRHTDIDVGDAGRNDDGSLSQKQSQVKELEEDMDGTNGANKHMNAPPLRTVSGPGPLLGELHHASMHAADDDTNHHHRHNNNNNSHRHSRGRSDETKEERGKKKEMKKRKQTPRFPPPSPSPITNHDLVNAPQGLFPAPLPPGPQRTETGSTAKNFRLLGRVTAKALQDNRLLDLPLSPLFYRRVLGRKVDIFDVRAIDTSLGHSLERLHAAEQASMLSGRPATVDGCSVEDLSLTFVVPGYTNYELIPNGSDIEVTSQTLRQYIDAVVDAIIGSGIESQVENFKAGFSSIFPLSSLHPFYEDEIEAMLCGVGEAWTVQGLASVIKFDHGYRSDSAPSIALLETLVELDAVDQRRFLRFVTGTPRLPPGGLGSLQPRLTVVRKLSAGMMMPGGDGGSAPNTATAAAAAAAAASPASFSFGSSGVHGSLSNSGVAVSTLADGDLPSVMTCANYLKLPPYSSKEVLKERLLFAIREGQGSFDLS